MPKVSILLPTLNSRTYLESRFDSILRQTLQDWELIILDGYSTDGTKELIEKFSCRDDRVKINFSKIRGIYTNFNRCIQLANGEYIYFATSDDTMDPTCLEKMVSTLDEYPECNLGHCKLKIIDEKGDEVKKLKWDNFFIIKYFDELINQKHIRFAPHDGILNFSGYPVYTSLTQLLIRKTLFDQIGSFLINFGAVADFEWGMRATLLANTIHIPEYLASWRMHTDQSTSVDYINRTKGQGGFLKMANHAFNFAKNQNRSSFDKFKKTDLNFILDLEKLHYKMLQNKSVISQGYTIGKWFVFNRKILRQWMTFEQKEDQFLHRKYLLEYLQFLMEKYGLDKNIKVLEDPKP